MDFEQKLSEHSKWLKGESGKKLVIKNENLRFANLSRANLSRANLSSTDMSCANLNRANLSITGMSCANLNCANLSFTDMSGANLSRANLSFTDMSGAVGIEPQHVWIASHLERTVDGYVCYKTFGEFFEPNTNWSVEEGAVITENVNFNRCDDCACGINVGTIEFVSKNATKEDIWECLIPFDALAGVCVPYNTDGKFRCEMVKLIKKHTREELVKKVNVMDA